MLIHVFKFHSLWNCVNLWFYDISNKMSYSTTTLVLRCNFWLYLICIYTGICLSSHVARLRTVYKGWLPTPYEYQCWQTCYFLDTYLFLDFKNDFKKKWVFKHFNSYRRIRKRERNWRYLSSQFRRFNIFRNHLFMAYVLIQLTAAVHWEIDFQENAS